jgi:cobalt-precorrin 5A hydrolase
MKYLADTNIYDAAVVVTDKDLYMVKPHVCLRPATLAVGLECRNGASSAEILAAISDACKKIGRSMKSLAVISTSAVYEDEIGLLATGQQIDVPVRFVDSNQLQELQTLYPEISSSDEAAALAVGNAATILGRIDHTNVKVAVAELGFRREHAK